MLDLLEQHKRTAYAGNLNENNINQKVTLMGWVHRRRDLGNLIFIDLRDITGIIQIVFDPKKSPFLSIEKTDQGVIVYV